MDYSFLKTLIDKVEKFDQEVTGSKDVSIFATWLQQEYIAESEEKDIKIDQKIQKREEIVEPIESRLAQLIAFLYRYAKIYMKKALEKSTLQTADEFGYLAGVLFEEGITKMALIDRNIQEKTTGIEIIKRLINKGLVRQEDDTVDRRSKILFVTDLGRYTFFEVIADMNKAGLIIGGNLTDSEKIELEKLLLKLEAFHQDIFVSERDGALDEILSKYLQ